MTNYSPQAKQTIANIDFGLLGIKKLIPRMGSMEGIRTSIFKEILVENGETPIFQDIPVYPVYPIYETPVLTPIDASDVVSPTDTRLVQEPCPEGYVRDVNGVCQPTDWTPPPPPDYVPCPAGYSKDASGNCVIVISNDTGGSGNVTPAPTPTPVATTPTNPIRISGGGGGGASTVKTAPAPTPTSSPAPATEPDKKTNEKTKWVLIGVAVLLVAVVTTYFIVKT